MSETVSTEPNDRSRTLLGIGEQVICWLEPSVVANWSVTGSGGDVDQQNSSWTTFTAVKSNDSPQYATVHAELPTSESECTLEFTVIKPTGEINVWDDSLDRAELGPPNLYMSHWIVFYAYVQPDTVSFYNVNFRENIPLNEWYWPDGTYDSYGEPNGLIKTFDVNYSNRWPDSCSDYNKPVSRLNDPNVGPIDFTIEANIPEEFQDDEGNWHAFLPNGLHKHFYRASDYKSKSAIIDDNTATAPEWMGPYKTTGSW